MTASAAHESHDRFRHEALLYSNAAEFLAGTVPFIEEGLAAGEAILVVEPADKIAALREQLGADSDAVQFADMAMVGANPALIIPAWRDFTVQNGLEGRRMRGIGEPIYPSRRPAELVECQRHEALLNVAFDGGAPWSLLCPYDTKAMGPAVINEARRSHPFVREGSTLHTNGDLGTGSWAAPYEAPFPEPPVGHISASVGSGELDRLRRLVADEARSVGLAEERISDLVLAANEVATNSVRHGGGKADVGIWRTPGAMVCELRDRGQFNRPLADRERPGSDINAGRGLWLANHLCDLVQIQSGREGTRVRIHMWLEGPR